MLRDADPKYFAGIYIERGYTGLRYGMDSLAAIMERKDHTKLFVPNTLFLFCGRSVNIPDEIPSAVRRYGNHFLASLLCIPKYNFYENISKGCYAPQMRQGLD